MLLESISDWIEFFSFMHKWKEFKRSTQFHWSYSILFSFLYTKMILCIIGFDFNVIIFVFISILLLFYCFYAPSVHYFVFCCSMWQHKVYRICVLIFLTFQHRFHEFFRTLLKHIICKIEHKIQSFTQKPRKNTHIYTKTHVEKLEFQI